MPIAEWGLEDYGRPGVKKVDRKIDLQIGGEQKGGQPGAKKVDRNIDLQIGQPKSSWKSFNSLMV